MLVDDTFAPQMAYRDALITKKRRDVYICPEEVQALASAVLDELIELLARREDYTCSESTITRPDGVVIDLAGDEPLLVAGRLTQQDLAILVPSNQGHRLGAGLVCFPAHWRLREKLDRSMAGVHRPVDAYTGGIDQRIERIFRALRPEQPLMRANALIYTDPDLHQPEPESSAKTIAPDAPRFVRVERQVLSRLRRAEGILFSIHTYLVRATSLPGNAYQRLLATRPRLSETDG